MLPRSDKNKRIHPACPPEVAHEVYQQMAAGVAGKRFFARETLSDVVARECPQIFEIPAAHGFELRLDLPENSHRALAKGRLSFQIRRKPLN